MLKQPCRSHRRARARVKTTLLFARRRARASRDALVVPSRRPWRRSTRRRLFRSATCSPPDGNLNKLLPLEQLATPHRVTRTPPRTHRRADGSGRGRPHGRQRFIRRRSSPHCAYARSIDDGWKPLDDRLRHLRQTRHLHEHGPPQRLERGQTAFRGDEGGVVLGEGRRRVGFVAGRGRSTVRNRKLRVRRVGQYDAFEEIVGVLAVLRAETGTASKISVCAAADLIADFTCSTMLGWSSNSSSVALDQVPLSQPPTFKRDVDGGTDRLREMDRSSRRFRSSTKSCINLRCGCSIVHIHRTTGSPCEGAPPTSQRAASPFAAEAARAAATQLTRPASRRPSRRSAAPTADLFRGYPPTHHARRSASRAPGPPRRSEAAMASFRPTQNQPPLPRGEFVGDLDRRRLDRRRRLRRSALHRRRGRAAVRAVARRPSTRRSRRAPDGEVDELALFSTTAAMETDLDSSEQVANRRPRRSRTALGVRVVAVAGGSETPPAPSRFPRLRRARVAFARAPAAAAAASLGSPPRLPRSAMSTAPHRSGSRHARRPRRTRRSILPRGFEHIDDFVSQRRLRLRARPSMRPHRQSAACRGDV